MAVEISRKYRLGEFELEPGKYLLKRGSEPIHLPELPFQVLVYLVENRERFVSRQELLERFWAGSDGYEETLTRCISTIRTQLGDPRSAPRFIETRKKVGYRYVGPLEEQAAASPSGRVEIERTHGIKIFVEEDDEGVPVLLPNQPDLAIEGTAPIKDLKVKQPGQIESVTPVQWNRLSKAKLIAAIFVVIALTFGTVWWYRHRARDTSATPGAIHSLAVLPLRNLSGDPTNEYFSDGLTDSLITALSKIENLKVISRSSVFRFKDKQVTPEEIGKNLGVAALLEGGVRNAGNSVRIDLRLVSVEDGRVLWASDEHDHALGDLFALQDEIARQVAAALRLRLSGDNDRQVARRYTDNIEAYQLYLQGRFYFNNYNSDRDLLRGIQYFQAATARDPDY